MMALRLKSCLEMPLDPLVGNLGEMIMNIRLIVGIAAFGLLAGCLQGTPDNPNAVKIRTASVEQVVSCSFLGPISTFGAALEGGMSAAMRKARNNTANLGGTHMVIVDASTTYNGYTHGVVQAEAYQCK